MRCNFGAHFVLSGISAITGAQGAPPEVCVPQVCVVQPRTPGAAIGVLQNNPSKYFLGGASTDFHT